MSQCLSCASLFPHQRRPQKRGRRENFLCFHSKEAEEKTSFVSPLNCQLSVKLDELADSCSDLSLFHNEVSSEEVQTSKLPVPISKEVLSVAPIMSGHPVMFVVGSKTPEEIDILVKESSVYYKMGQLGLEDVTKATLKLVDPHLTKLDREVSELIESINSLLLTKGSVLEEKRKSQWRSLQASLDRDTKDYALRMRQRADQVKSSLNSQATSSSFHAEILDLWKQIAILEAEKAEREVQEVEKVVKENETLKEIETKQALAEAKNQQSSDGPEENDSEDINDSKVFDKEDVKGIETMVYVINESLNVSDLYIRLLLHMIVTRKLLLLKRILKSLIR